MNASTLSLLALVPLMAGTNPHDQREDEITVALCNGGTITLNLGRDKNEPKGDCQQKGCHTGACRKKDSFKTLSPA